jgi:hypothetical protein
MHDGEDETPKEVFMLVKRTFAALLGAGFLAASLTAAMAQEGGSGGSDPAGRQDIKKDQSGDRTTPRSTEPSQSPREQPK